MESAIVSLRHGGDVLFLLLGAVMVFAMHAGFAFLEVGTVRKKSQVNAFVKILCDWSVSTVIYFLIGYPIAYGINFYHPAASLLGNNQGYELVRFFFLLCFAACIPAIISGGIAERARFWPQVVAGAIFVGVTYPVFESFIWGQNSAGLQGLFKSWCGAPFHDFAGSVVVHSMGGWLALPAVLILGPRIGRFVRQQEPADPDQQHPLSGPGQLDSGGRLVRFQCHERPEPGRDLRAGGGQFAAGHGRGGALRPGRQQERSRFRPQRRSGRTDRHLRRLRPGAPPGRFSHGRHRVADLRLRFPVGAGEVEDRRCPRRLAPARHDRHLGRHQPPASSVRAFSAGLAGSASLAQLAGSLLAVAYALVTGGLVYLAICQDCSVSGSPMKPSMPGPTWRFTRSMPIRKITCARGLDGLLTARYSGYT